MSDPLQFAQSEIVKATELYERAVIERNEVELVRDKLYDILRRTAIALKGPEGLQCHSFHDLPEVAEKLRHELPDPIGHVSAPSGTLQYKHLVRSREPRDEEVGALLYAIHPSAR